jgi:hypothetical protein
MRKKLLVIETFCVCVFAKKSAQYFLFGLVWPWNSSQHFETLWACYVFEMCAEARDLSKWCRKNSIQNTELFCSASVHLRRKRADICRVIKESLFYAAQKMLITKSITRYTNFAHFLY